MLLWLVACASLAGLEELDALPADFPLALEGETGKITRMAGPDGQLAVDVVFDDEEHARAGYAALRAQAESRGFAFVDEHHMKKRDETVLQGPDGKLQLGCCQQRADRRWLLFVSWWKR
ncbi:MAG: hypothetical protein H6737_29935 [Alphaproteobacteria bacterium]|nr:hypothetical protein [Alphaproteobacteria bacterium]